MATHLGIRRGGRESFSPDDLPKAKLKRAVRALDSAAENVGIRHRGAEADVPKALVSLATHPDDVLLTQHPTPVEFNQGVRFYLPQKAVLKYPARAATNVVGRTRYYDLDKDVAPNGVYRNQIPKRKMLTQPSILDLDEPIPAFKDFPAALPMSTSDRIELMKVKKV